MSRKKFVTLLLGFIGGILFALGMCMCLISEWNAFLPGIAVGAAGVIVLLILLIVRRRQQGKPAISWNAKAMGAIALGIFGALALGVGMCMSMVWEGLMIPGILVGILGLALLFFLIPLLRGLKPSEKA